ncbi:MAG: hypothetical protein Q8R20_03770 [Nanoarchaeota archaeon]|nr:hypothetical protein [Nanoarchaeota archaeon]
MSPSFEQPRFIQESSTKEHPEERQEMPARRLAREMLERFLARIRKSDRVQRDEKAVNPLLDLSIYNIDFPAPPRAGRGRWSRKKNIPDILEDVTPEETKKETPEVVAVPDQSGVEPPKSEVIDTQDAAGPQKTEGERKIDRGDYESIVTNNYFEGWDELEIEGNAGIKDTIRANIIQAEERNELTYKGAAVDLGISVEEFKARLQEKVEEMVARAGFFRATEFRVLEQIMNVDGRWKSQFETATSNGLLNPQCRAKSEMRMFGFNEAENFGVLIEQYAFGGERLSDEVLAKDRERRPIYGYFSDEDHGAINHTGKIPPSTNLQKYGAVNVKIKRERALEKATVTFHDSLDHSFDPGRDWPPTPAVKPHFTSFRFIHPDGGHLLEKLKGPSVMNWGEDYTEVQYHGQLTMDDVESIHISTKNLLYPEEIEEIRRIFHEYKQRHPESTIQLIEF